MYKYLEQMSAQEKNALMKKIVRDYKETKAKYNLLLNNNFYPKLNYSTVKENAVYYNNTEVKLINYVDQKEDLLSKLTYYDAIINQLDDRSKEIILHDFIDQESNWWISFYSKSAYYRTRRKAVDCFLSYIID